MLQYTTKVWIDEVAKGELTLLIPKAYEATVKQMVEKAVKFHNAYLFVRLDLPKQPRTTGKHSQNNFAHGACSDIAEQLSTDAKQYGHTEVYEAMKRLAVKEGYPTVYEEISDSVQPKHMAEATMEEATIVNRVITRFADEHHLWLTRYDKKGFPYRSLGGRTREEMEALK